MTPPSSAKMDQKIQGEHIRVRGLVQGVGFRPTVWRLAKDCGLSGDVLNDGQGVLIRAWGTVPTLDEFVRRLQKESSILTHIDTIHRTPAYGDIPKDGFKILESKNSCPQTGVVSDAASCPQCVEETLSPLGRRYRYPFTNCTHCGPRLSIIQRIPYDRHNTSMAEFPLCSDCAREYENPSDRRFHAQPVACHVCGPRAWLELSDGRVFSIESFTQLDDVDAACTVLQNGEILALKGIGGFHLACDATNANAVADLRKRKGRYHKPFALMARTLEMIQRYCTVGEVEKKILQSLASPIVLLPVHGREPLPKAVAPGLKVLGFMLPYTPLHHLLLKRMDRPIVLTSGNFSDEPQCTDNRDARMRLRPIADYLLLNDRDIVNRVDDSVVRVMAGETRILRRARGYAPAPLPLPPGFEQAPEILALGGELKNTFCLIKNGQAVLSQHIGDLENAAAFADYKKNIELYLQLYQHQPTLLAIDMHPEYLSTKHGKIWADRENIPVEQVQHHHAHIASCMAENNVPLDTRPVLGIALDGLGFGEDGTLWGGEFLLADYRQFKRQGTFKPVPLIGGSQAMREPWRNTYAHILTGIGWDQYKMQFQNLELTGFLESQPLSTLDVMLDKEINCPPTSSCGRLFDAVAAAIGVCRERAGYEGQAAIELEAIIEHKTFKEEGDDLAYPFIISSLRDGDLLYIESAVMWQIVLNDLLQRTPAGVMAARFHKGLANAIVTMTLKLIHNQNKRFINTVVLSGGVWQNKVLMEEVVQRLREKDYNVLTQSRVPANDGGLSLGQAAIAAARQIKKTIE